MTEEILTQVQRLSLDELPDSLSSEDLSQYFTLSPYEISEAKANRGAENQVGFALQLCTLRMIGRFASDTTKAPVEVLNYLASQLNLSALTEFNYPRTCQQWGIVGEFAHRPQTKWDHAQRIRQLTGFVPFDSEKQNALEQAIKEQALQCNHSSVLMAFARQKLYHDRVVRPSTDTLERLMGQIKKETEDEGRNDKCSIINDKCRKLSFIYNL